MGTGGENLIGSTKITKTNNITIIEEVRQLLQINKPLKLAYIRETNGTVTIHKASDLLSQD